MIALVDYRAGNVFSVTSALERLGAEVVLTSDADVILSADRVVFPGVGYAKSAMDELEARGVNTENIMELYTKDAAFSA